MSEPKRLHPISTVSSALQQLKDLIIPFLIFIVFGSKNGGFQLIFPIAILGLVLIGGIIYWLRFTYRLEEGELRIEYGLFVRKKRYIPFERIQSLDLSEGILHRPFGLVRVKVETAGSSKGEAEAVLTAISKEEANLIQQTIFSAKNETNDTLAEESVQENRDETVYKISTRELVLLASTSGGVGVVISAVVAFAFQFEEVIPYDNMFNQFESFIASGVVFVSILVFLGFLIAWLIALVGMMAKYARFTVTKVGDDLIISRGLLEKRQLTIPLHRIQAVRVTENLIRQPLGYCTVYLESAGGSVLDADSSKVLVLPIIKKNRVSDILSPYLTDYHFEPSITPAPSRALKRYLVRGLLWSLPLAAIPVIFFRPWGYLAILFLVLSLPLSYFNYKDAGWTLDQNQLTLRFRTINKNTIFMKRNRIQSLSTRESRFQRIKKLATIHAKVMSGSGGTSGKVVDLEKEDVYEIYKWYSYTK